MSLTKATYSMIDGAYINIVDFGADATGVADSASAIQAAIDAIPSTGGTLYVPTGTYALASGVIINKAGSVHVLGEGGYATNASGTSKFIFTGSGACITIGSSGATVQNGCRISNLYIQGDNSAGQIGVKVFRTYRNLFECVAINEMLGVGSIGFEFDGTGDITIINELFQCGVRKVTTGVKLTKVTSTRINGGFWNAVGGTNGVDIISDDTVILEGANFDGWTTAVQTANVSGTFRGLRLLGCRFEGNATAVNISASVQISTLVGNYFNMGGSGTGINVASGANVVLSDNVGHNVTAGVGSFITNANDSATGNNTILFAPLINRAVGQKDIVFSDLTTTVTGTGSTTIGALTLAVNTGATAGSTAIARTNGTEGWSVGKAYTVINWSKKFVATFCVSRALGGSANGKLRITLGKNTGSGVGDLATKGVGITFNRFQPVAAVHDGSTLTTTDIESFNIDVATHNFTIVGHGNGTFDFSYDGKAPIRLTAGPVGDGASGDSLLQFEADNGADSVSNALIVHDARIWFEQ